MIIITDQKFRYALINTQILPETVTNSMVMGDIAWLDFDRIRGDDLAISVRSERSDTQTGMKRKRTDENAVENDEGSAG